MKEELIQPVVHADTEQKEKIAEDLSFELGQELGQMSWLNAQEKIAELNKDLKEGDKSWKIPTIEEWNEIFRPFAEAKAKGASEEEKVQILKDIRQGYGLQEGVYWSSTERQPGSNLFVDTIYGTVAEHVDMSMDLTQFDNSFVRCIRDRV